MKKITLIAALVFTATTFAQKTNLTNAVLEYRNYSPMGGDPAKNKKALENAKGYIDLAAEHPETKEDEKMYFHRGAIYYCLIESSMMTQQALDDKTIESYFTIAQEYMTKAYKAPKGKFKSDAKEFVDTRYGMTFNFALANYNEKKYADAAMMFLGAYQIRQLLSEEDADSKKNALICMENVVSEKTAAKEYDKAVEFAANFQEVFPKEMSIYTTMANVYLQKGDNVGAEKVIADAIKANPSDKSLYYYLGTIYMDLKNNEKAEENLAKALELDPNYTEAQYQLGAHLYNWAADIQTEINNLKFGDPNEEKLRNQVNEKRNKAIPYLEKYIEKDPNNKGVLEILFKTHRSLGNTEKALAYKKRMDEIK